MSKSEGFYRHETSVVESASVGAGTRIWSWVHILPGAVIGEGCNICDHTFIENDVVIGDRVTVKCGVQLWDGIHIEDDVFIGPNATFTNDPYPRSKQHPEQFARTVVKRGASVGANATILAGITIGEKAMIGAGAVVTRNVPSRAIVAGNPAVIIGYEGVSQPGPQVFTSAPSEPSVRPSRVTGVTLHRLPSAVDMRGQLSFAEIRKHVPFDIKRFFVVYGVPSQEVRGEHAHIQLHEFVVCVHGKCHLIVDDGQNTEEFLLDDPTVGIYIAPMVWSVQYKYTPDTVLLAVASDYYDASDYIRDYSEFLRIVNTRSAK